MTELRSKMYSFPDLFFVEKKNDFKILKTGYESNDSFVKLRLTTHARSLCCSGGARTHKLVKKKEFA